MNILTFDIEDWWLYDYHSIGKKEDYLPRLNNYLEKILNLLDLHDFQATFFCLGEVATKYPEIIKKISTRGHHIGCHSYSHRFLGDLTPVEVAEDTKRVLGVLENLTGEKVITYRAPAFSIMEKNKWVFEILAENGITQDCSIFPANRSFGGFPDFKQKQPSIIRYNEIEIKEFPMSTTTILGNEIAYSGGGYFRLFPYWKTKSIIKKSDYVMTYFHIKDFDKNQKREYRSVQEESGYQRYIKNHVGLKNNFSKFSKLLSDFNFLSVQQADKLINWDEAPKIYL